MGKYTVQISKQADKKLSAMRKVDRNKITEKIGRLAFDPEDKVLDIKPLTGTKYNRLRVNNWRIIFEKCDEIKLILIEKIKPRGDAYK